LAAYNASSIFIAWYDALPPAVRRNRHALRFFRWVALAESMSREWRALNRLERRVRWRHFELLRTTVGSSLLRGIAAPPRP
jgi:hypothetical protein